MIKLKILIADSDRDFLASFQKLLELEQHQVTTVFDGTQVIVKTVNHHYDIVILNKDIPRVDSKKITEILNKAGIPVILLLNHKINSDILMNDILANAYLKFPFFPNELTDLITDIIQKIHSKEKKIYADIEIDPAHFMLCEKIRVTNTEINLFELFIHQKKVNLKNMEPYINSLNNKLEKLNKKTRIKYQMGEGYRLVTDYE